MCIKRSNFTMEQYYNIIYTHGWKIDAANIHTHKHEYTHTLTGFNAHTGGNYEARTTTNYTEYEKYDECTHALAVTISRGTRTEKLLQTTRFLCFNKKNFFFFRIYYLFLSLIPVRRSPYVRWHSSLAIAGTRDDEEHEKKIKTVTQQWLARSCDVGSPLYYVERLNSREIRVLAIAIIGNCETTKPILIMDTSCSCHRDYRRFDPPRQRDERRRFSSIVIRFPIPVANGFLVYRPITSWYENDESDGCECFGQKIEILYRTRLWLYNLNANSIRNNDWSILLGTLRIINLNVGSHLNLSPTTVFT